MRSVSIDLDKPRRLRFDLNALADAERAGVTFADGLSFGFHTLRTLFWVGLKWEDRGLTEQRMGQILQDYLEKNSLDKLAETLAEALNASGIMGNSEGAGETGSPPG